MLPAMPAADPKQRHWYLEKLCWYLYSFLLLLLEESLWLGGRCTPVAVGVFIRVLTVLVILMESTPTLPIAFTLLQGHRSDP